MTNHELLTKGEALYSDVNYSNAKWILAFLNNWSLDQLFRNLTQLSTVSSEKYFDLIQENLGGKPLSYIIGQQEFLGLLFKVNHHTFIPRTETQELVENVLYFIDENFQEEKALTLLDLATGTGAIGISLALAENRLNVVGSDISEQALQVAGENALSNHCHNIRFIKSNLLEQILEEKLKFDILVSNPPYIGATEDVAENVKDFEPHLALFSQNEGLYFYEEVFKNAKRMMNHKFLLAFEFGWKQKASLEKLVQQYLPHNKYFFLRDFNNNWRMLFIFSE